MIRNISQPGEIVSRGQCRMNLSRLPHTIVADRTNRRRYCFALCARRTAIKCPPVILVALGLALIPFPGCSKGTAPGPVAPATRASVVQVLVGTDSVSVETPVSRFVLFPNGYLQASLVRDGKLLTLDSPVSGSGQRVVANK